jgi:adenosylcobinamide-GDP ribazoletransferase
MNDFLRAFSLLTVVPVRPRWDNDAPLGRAMAFYPLVGLIMGGLLAGVAALLIWLTRGAESAALLRSALLLIVWTLLSGGLHLDGWGDACDGLLPTVERARRLEILRDPRMGSFGVIGIALILLLKLAALHGLPGNAALILAPTLGRWGVVLAAYGWPSARPGGMGDRFRQGLGRAQIALATMTALAATALVTWIGAGWAPLIALAVAFLVALAIARFAAGRLGGLTGDIYGAIVEGVEVMVLVVMT